MENNCNNDIILFETLSNTINPQSIQYKDIYTFYKRDINIKYPSLMKLIDDNQKFNNKLSNQILKELLDDKIYLHLNLLIISINNY